MRFWSCESGREREVGPVGERRREEEKASWWSERHWGDVCKKTGLGNWIQSATDRWLQLAGHGPREQILSVFRTSDFDPICLGGVCR